MMIFLFIFIAFHCNHDDAIYYCPMHPDYTSKRPGDCPICGMKLIEKKHKSKSITYEHNEHKSHKNQKLTLKISEEKQSLIGVKTIKAEKKKINISFVSTGQVLYNPELYSSFIEYKESYRLPSEVAGGFRQQAKVKLLRQGLTERDIALWASKNPEIFLKGRTGNNAYITTQIFEKDIANLKIGMKVKVKTSSYPNEIFWGKVIGWFHLIDEKNRSTDAWIEVYDPKKILIARMFTETEFNMQKGEIVAIPRDAVIRTGLKDIVYKKISPNEFIQTIVTIGEESNGFVPVLNGLEDGEEVVVSANFLLDSEARLQLGGIE